MARTAVVGPGDPGVGIGVGLPVRRTLRERRDVSLPQHQLPRHIYRAHGVTFRPVVVLKVKVGVMV